MKNDQAQSCKYEQLLTTEIQACNIHEESCDIAENDVAQVTLNKASDCHFNRLKAPSGYK